MSHAPCPSCLTPTWQKTASAPASQWILSLRRKAPVSILQIRPRPGRCVGQDCPPGRGRGVAASGLVELLSGRVSDGIRSRALDGAADGAAPTSGKPTKLPKPCKNLPKVVALLRHAACHQKSSLLQLYHVYELPPTNQPIHQSIK